MNLVKISYTLIFLLIHSLISFSQDVIENKEELLVGKLYQPGKNRIDGHPFLESTEFIQSKLIYKDIKYDHLFINYDILNQEIILYQTFDSLAPAYIILNSNMIQEFEIELNGVNHLYSSRYKNIEGLDKGVSFYEVIYDGNLKYLAGKYKEIKEMAINNETDSYIFFKDYYLVINNKAIKIKNKRDLLEELKEFKKEIQLYIKKNRFQIKPANLQEIKNVLIFYESLKFR